MRLIKRIIIIFVLLDNFLTNLPKKYIFKSNYVLEGKCKQCGVCCQEILLKMTPAQIRSKLFTNLAIKWISWLFDFILLKIDYEHGYLAFTCKHVCPDGKPACRQARCGNYFWRPSVCRNYPLVDYFEEPRILPGCGFRAKLRL